MGQPGLMGHHGYSSSDGSNDYPTENLGILKCKKCPLTNCVEYGNPFGFCAMTKTGKGTGYEKNKE